MKRKTLLSLFTLVLTAVPLFALAQTGGFVPCGDEGEPACQACHFANMLDTVLTWLIGILAVVTAIFFIVAGLRLVTSGGDVTAKEGAKKLITNTFIGFVIVLAAWVILDLMIQSLVNPTFFDKSATVVPWQTIECVAQPESLVVAVVLLPGPSGGSTSLTLGPSCNPGTSNFPACATAGTPAAESGTVVNSSNLGPSCNPGTSNFPACATAPAASGVTVDTSNLSSTCNPGTSNFPDCAQVSGTVGSSGSEASPLTITIDGTSGSPSAITVDPTSSYTVNDPAMPDYGLEAGDNHGNSLTIIGTQSEGGMIRVTDNTTGQTFDIGCRLISPPIAGCI